MSEVVDATGAAPAAEPLDAGTDPRQGPGGPQEGAGGASAPVPGSLRDRMRKRTEELSKRETEIFPVPMYDALLAVELRIISWAKTEQFAEKNQRNPTGAILATAADEIVAATVRFYEVIRDDTGITLDAVEPETVSWKQLATDLAGKQLHDMAGERAALIAMCTDQGVMALNGAYREFVGGKDTGLAKVAREVRRGF